ncbi:MAG TPA: hypothetical protein VG965_06800 [Patescibacteria group bacterium]|nr:hypothetical protein [Patescibacteria group bacterium]
MTKNPFANAAAALAYIIILINVITIGGKPIEHNNSLFIPIIMLSLFTLSAAAMAYFFFYNPVLMFFDNKKKQAFELALKSFGAFGGYVLVLIFLIYSGLLK